MQKRLCCVFMVVCMAFCSNFAFAADLSTIQGEQVDLKYVKVNAMSAGLSMSRFGCATCSGMVTLRPGYYADVTIELLKLENGRWNSIKSWSGSGAGIEGIDISGTYWVDRGTYMTKTSAYVTDSSGNYVESPSVTSVIKEY